MHHAPAVSFSTGRSRLAGLLLGMVLFAGALALLAWCYCVQTTGLVHLSAWLVWLLTSALSVQHWAQSPAVCLAWDNSEWTWCAAEGQASVVQGGPQLVLDLPDTLLMRLCSTQGRVFYVWADRHTSPAHWLPLRRAVLGQRKP